MEYSLEELNFFRLCKIAFDIFPVELRKIFKQEWDFLYSATPCGKWQDTAQNGKDFYHEEIKGKKTPMKVQCLNTVRNGNTEEWDCTCLFSVILYSNTIGSTLTSVARKAVDDLRQVRNDVAHTTEAKLTDVEFINYGGIVLNAFTVLGLPTNEIEDIKNQTSFPTEELENLKKQVCDLKTELDKTKSDLDRTKSELNQTKSDFEEAKNTLQSTQAELNTAKEENKSVVQELSSKLEPFCFLTLKPPHEVIRRSNEIIRITNRMQELHNGANAAVSTIYLSGNPGCGKSQLARLLGHEVFSKRSDSAEDMMFVATLNAKSVETLADSYITLARQLGITEYVLTNLETSKRVRPGETIRHIQRLILPKVRKYSKWLIIADNVVVLKLVRDFLPQTGSEEWGHGQVLITTQDSTSIPHNAPYTYHESFSKGMQPDDAVELLEKVSRIGDKEKAGNVAKVLDYQPLGLAAAAYYAQTVVKNGSPNYSWTEYLEGLTHSQRETTESLLASESSAYAKTTATAVKMALQRAVETDEIFHQTFSFLALCSREVVPLDAVVAFVKARLMDQPEELIKAKILRSSLILALPVEEGKHQYLGLHNIVHAVLKQGAIFKFEPSEKNQNVTEAVKIFRFQLELNEGNYALLSKLTSHCKTLLEHVISPFPSPEGIFVPNLKLFVKVDEFAHWLVCFANACVGLSDLSFAKYIVDLTCSLVENISDTEKGALLKGRIFSTSGGVYWKIGEHNQAKEFHEEALMIAKKIFGEKHAYVATSYSNLGLVYYSIGEYNQAKEFHAKALMIEKKIFGEEHAEVARSYNNLGSVYYSTGQYNQAKEFHAKALMIKKKIFGEEHEAVATSYNNLGLVYYSIGEYNQAKEFYAKALMIKKKIFGEEHEAVATSCNNLGSVYDSIGEYNQAKEFHAKALMIWKKIFGEEHHVVATSYSHLGSVYASIGEYNQAKEFHTRALMIKKKIFGEEHDAVATSYTNLGLVYYSTGEYNQAEQFYANALMIQKKIFGEGHAEVATSYNNLGSVYYSIGEYNQAKKFHTKALMIEKKIFGEEHAAVATNYNKLGSVYDSIGEYNQAKEFYTKALMVRKTIFGEEHDAVATSYNNLGSVYHNIGEYSQAKEFYTKALMIQKKIFGEEHESVATSYNNLGSMYQSIGEHNQAKEFHTKALMTQKKIFGEEHEAVATSYNNLGSVYQSIGEYNQAKEFYEKELMIKKKIFGEEHVKRRNDVYKNLAMINDCIARSRRSNEITQGDSTHDTKTRLSRTAAGSLNMNGRAKSCFCSLL